MSAEAAAKHPIKKIKPHVFRVEIIRILIKTLLGSGVAVTFKIGPHEDRTKNWMEIWRGQAKPDNPSYLELEAEMIYNEQTRLYEPLKAILKVHLQLYAIAENNELDRQSGIAGVVYLNLEDERNNYCSLDTRVVPIENCSDINAKLQFKLTAADLSTKNDDVVSEPGGEIRQSGGLTLPEELDLEDEEEEQQILNPKIQALSRELKSLQEQYQKKVKVNYELADEVVFLKQELKKETEEANISKKQLQKSEKDYRNLLIDKQALETDERLKQMMLVKKEYEFMKKKYMEDNINLKKTIKQHEKEKINYEQAIQKLIKIKENSHKPQMDRMGRKIRELEGILSTRLQQNYDLNRKKKDLQGKLKRQQEFMKQRLKTLEQSRPELVKLTFMQHQQSEPKQCEKCSDLNIQYRTKEVLYEQQLINLQFILNETKSEVQKIKAKLLRKIKKCKELLSKVNQIEQYKNQFYNTLKELKLLIGEIDRKVDHNIEDPKYSQPEGYEIALKQILNQIRVFLIARPKADEKTCSSKQNSAQFQLLKEKDLENKILTKQLERSCNRLNQLQEECNHIRVQFQKVCEINHQRSETESPTPNFVEVSFSKLPSIDRSDDNHINELLRLPHKIKEQKRASVSERMYKSLPRQITEESQLSRLDEEFAFGAQKEQTLKRIIALNEKQCADLDRNFKLLNDDYKQLKIECEGYKDTISKLRSEIDILRQYVPTKKSRTAGNNLIIIQQQQDGIDFKEEIKEDIKDLIDSINIEPDIQEKDQENELLTPRHLSKDNIDRRRMQQLAEIKQQTSRRLKGVGLELLRSHMMRVPRCTAVENQHSTVEYNNIRNRIEQVYQYLENIGR